MKTRLSVILAIIVLGSLAAVAYYRSGLLSLPEVPKEVNGDLSGLQGLEGMKRMDDELSAGSNSANQPGEPARSADAAQSGEIASDNSGIGAAKSALDEIRSGNE